MGSAASQMQASNLLKGAMPPRPVAQVAERNRHVAPVLLVPASAFLKHAALFQSSCTESHGMMCTIASVRVDGSSQRLRAAHADITPTTGIQSYLSC